MPREAALVFNGGSSSWKSALFDLPAAEARAREATPSGSRARASLTWQRPGDMARLTATAPGGASVARDVRAERADGVAVLAAAYREIGCDLARACVVGHRIVHGGPRFAGSVRIDDAVVTLLRDLEPFAPEHNPVELSGIAAARELLPDVPQIAAFDTAFHRTLPAAAYTYGGPREWLERDIRRYGFHGLNVAYCAERGAQLLGRELATLRVAVAHLGGGCSVTAVAGGASRDTTMGFTPLDGIPMGTRSGSVDPGILLYLLRAAAPETTAAAAAGDLERTLGDRSGFLGLAGASDVRDVVAAQAAGDTRAALALDVFTYRTAAAIASFLPALGGLDVLIFSGGIGEHAAGVRARICERLTFCGVGLDAERNAASEADGDVAAARSAVRVLVIAADEEWYIGREGARILAATGASEV